MPIVIRSLNFPGATEPETSLLQAAAKPLSGQDYLRTKMRVQEKFNFLPVYHARGYLKAEFAEAQAKVAQDGPQTLVDVSFPVDSRSEIQTGRCKDFPATMSSLPRNCES